MALSAKAREGNIIILSSMSLPEPKTGRLEALLRKTEWAVASPTGGEKEEEEKMKRLLFVDAQAIDPNMALASRNLPYAMALPQVVRPPTHPPTHPSTHPPTPLCSFFQPPASPPLCPPNPPTPNRVLM